MKIDGHSPYQLIVPKIEAGSSQHITLTDRKSTTKVGESPKENYDALKNIYTDKDLKKIGVLECETCANRTYIDDSNDPGVSFKTPGKIDPAISASVVMSHELEHVSSEQAKTTAEGREIVSASILLHASICPECGVSYVSGGETKTVTKGKNDYGASKEFFKGLKIDQKL